MVEQFVRRAADWIKPVAGLARVQCLHLMAIRSLATPATVGIYITAVRLINLQFISAFRKSVSGHSFVRL